MLRRTPLFSAVDPTLFCSGLQPDYQELKQLLWAEADNVRSYNQKIVRDVPPQLQFVAGAAPVRGLSQQRDLEGVRWVWAASGADIVRWYGPAVESIFSYASYQQDEISIAPATFYDFVHWGDWTIFNSSTGPLKIYKQADDAVTTLGDAPEDVQKIGKRANFLLAFGYGERGTRVGWSNADDIETWTATSTNLAGSLTIDDFDTRIKTAYKLANFHAVYGEDQMAAFTYISAPYYFGQQMLLDGIGACGKLAVTGDGNSNYGVGRNGVWWTDGSSYRYIDDFLHDYLQEQVNWDQQSKITAARNDVTGCFDFYFPMRGSLTVNEGWSFDPRVGGWSKIGPASVADERRLFARPLMGTDDGKVKLLQNDPTVAGALNLCTKPLLMQYQDQQGLSNVHVDQRVDEIELLVKDAVGVQFRLECAQRVEDVYDVSAWQDVQPNSATYLMEAMPSGVYWRLRFRSIIDDWSFNFQGFLCFGMVEGSKR